LRAKRVSTPEGVGWPPARRAGEADALDLRPVIRQIPLFRSLREPEIDALVRIAVTRQLRTRETLFYKGDPGSEVYAIISGRLKAVSHAEDGRELVFAILDPGDVFGEIALFDQRPRSATVVAFEDSSLLVIRDRDLLPLLHANEELMRQALRFLGERLRRVSALAEDVTFLSFPARLAKRLLGLARTYGTTTAEGIHIDLKLSQRELGELVGVSRESVNKQIKLWTDDRLIHVDDGHITILGTRSLETLASLIEI
jgi:CRP-like cAMP-binding protein